MHRPFLTFWQWLTATPAWVRLATIAVLLGASWFIVYGAGGTHTAYPHLFYVPVVMGAAWFGVRGGVAIAIIATVLCGPLMPLDVAELTRQEPVNWLVRGVFLTAIAALSGLSVASLRDNARQFLLQRFQSTQSVDASHDAGATHDDPWNRLLRDALDNHAFRVVFQPIYDLDTGNLAAVEALTRFHNTAVDAPPNVWFDAAARLGLSTELELATIARALNETSDLPEHIVVSFNASATTLVDDQFLDLLDHHHNRRLMAEITEHAEVKDYPQLNSALEGPRARGLALAVDDAGAGFASLRHVVLLRPDCIKIDRSFTQNLGADPIRQAFAESIVGFAQQSDVAVLAEGIEDAGALRIWRKLGADAAQGYFLGRPDALPVNAVSPVLARAGRHARPALRSAMFQRRQHP